MSMLFGVIAACVNPCMYMSIEYAEAMAKVRADFEGNDIGVKDVVDTGLDCQIPGGPAVCDDAIHAAQRRGRELGS